MALYTTLTLKQNSQSVAANTSSVTGTITVRWTYGQYDFYKKTSEITINGTKYSFKTPNINPNNTSSGSQTLYSKTVTVPHDAEGKKTVTGSCKLNTAAGTGGNVSDSDSLKLTDIPRASTPLAPATMEIGETYTISISRASTAFDHTVKWRYGSYSKTIATDVETSAEWTVPEKLIELITTKSTDTIYIDCVTYNGTTNIGTKSDEVSITIPADIKPTIMSHTVADTNLEIVEKFGAFVQNKSVAKVTTAATPGEYATLNLISTIHEGKTYNGESVEFPLAVVGEQSITTKAIDSRIREDSVTKTINVLSYLQPTIHRFTAHRANSEGEPDEKGKKVVADISFNIEPINNLNDKFYKLEMSIDGTNWTTLFQGNDYSYDGIMVTEEVFDTSYPYQVRLTLTDYFGRVTMIQSIPVGYTIINWGADGRSIAFGKVSQQEGMEVDMPVKFYDKVDGLVTEEVKAIYREMGVDV